MLLSVLSLFHSKAERVEGSETDFAERVWAVLERKPDWTSVQQSVQSR